ncbi:MAG: TonB-dependent receptor [Panacagrimonas sp.]
MFRMHPLAAAAAALLFAQAAFAADSTSTPPAGEPSSTAQADAPETPAVSTAIDPSFTDEAQEIDTIVVSGKRSALTSDLPQTSVGITGTELRERVFVNTEDALKHAPTVTMRKRYIGDRNALIGGRSHNVLQAPRGVVYADGVLLSNFLGRFNAPRWNMVAPEEISRVDILYGPYSALYPGNSIGTTVLLTTREPAQATASSRAQYFTESFSEYGYEDDYSGHQFSVFGGNRWGDLTGTLGVNQLANRSHPMQYATGTLCVPDPAADPPRVCPTGVDVTGAILDQDPKGADRLILGPDGGAIEDNLQNQIKTKLAYENEWLRADGQIGFWRNDYEREGLSFLRDAAGNTVTRGAIRFQDRVYTVADSAFGPREGIEEHLMTALTARTKRDGGWNYSSVVSLYDIGEDELRASVPTGSGETENLLAGTITDGGSGKGWWNLDLQANYGREDLAHAFTFGYYRSRYELDQERFSTSNWKRGGRDSLIEDTEGATLIQAVYAQDVWKFAPEWSATAGLRLERWEAFDGLRANALNNFAYPERSEEDASPKLSIAYAPEAYTLRYSVGRGVRYPTVSELFQGSIGTTQPDPNAPPVATIVNNDPNLKPEDSTSHEIAWEKIFADKHRVRVSLFRDDIKDTIHQQTNVNVTPNITNIQNVDQVVTQGIELVYGARDLLPSFDLDANLSLVDSEIEKNGNNPASVGKNWVRIPDVRANIVANWRFAPNWNANLAALHTGKNYAEIDNKDDGGCQFFGCASKFTTVDAKLGYTFRERFELGLGMSNLTDEDYYEFHPYPQRTLLAEFRGTF